VANHGSGLINRSGLLDLQIGGARRLFSASSVCPSGHHTHRLKDAIERLSRQSQPQHQQYAISDYRTACEWPAGATYDSRSYGWHGAMTLFDDMTQAEIQRLCAIGGSQADPQYCELPPWRFQVRG
jgi:hypothetical protein